MMMNNDEMTWRMSSSNISEINSLLGTPVFFPQLLTAHPFLAFAWFWRNSEKSLLYIPNAFSNVLKEDVDGCTRRVKRQTLPM